MLYHWSYCPIPSNWTKPGVPGAIQLELLSFAMIGMLATKLAELFLLKLICRLLLVLGRAVILTFAIGAL